MRIPYIYVLYLVLQLDEVEYVKLPNDLLLKNKDETKRVISIHVDIPSGEFVAPVIYLNSIWALLFPWVKSINANGKKCGLMYVRTNWKIWTNPDI